MTETRLPLAGLRVVDFSLLAAGPAASKMLADYGAEVILVESEAAIVSSGGSRQAGPQGLSPINTSYFHNKYNPNKQSVTIDLAQERGREVVKRLVAVSDVFLANRRQSVVDKLGLSYEVLSAVRPELIYLTMPTMGEGGPRSFYGGVSWGIQAMAGLNMISGFADRPPTSPSPYSHPDVSCNPLHAVVAIMAALRHRRRSGRGQRIELAQYESSICWTGPALLQYTVNGTLMERSENRHPSAAPHDVYRCSGEDGWCAISVFTDQQWPALARTIGRPDLVDDPRYATALARKAHESDFRDIIEPWTSTQDRRRVAQTLQAAGVPCGPVNDFDELLHHDPQLRHRQVWTEVEHPELGTALFEDWGFRLSQVSVRPRSRAPLLGEHNDRVLQEILGMSEDEVNELLIEGVLR
jgi:benzylsuccinate CoA-transferase BbsF subunit